RAGGAAGRAAGGQQGLVDGLPAERRPEGAMALPARGMGLESVEELEATSPAQRPGAAARVRAAARALPVGDPGPLPLAAGNQSGRRHQQQDQGHQAGGLRLPGRRLLLPEDPGGLPRTWVKNQKKAPPERGFPGSRKAALSDQLRHSAGTYLFDVVGVVAQVHSTGEVGSSSTECSGVHFITGTSAAATPMASVGVVVMMPFLMTIDLTY